MCISKNLRALARTPNSELPLPMITGGLFRSVGLPAKALRFLEMHNNHNYLYYGDPGGAATAKYGGRPLHGQLRSTACCDSPPINDRGFRSVGLCAKALRFL